MAIMDYNNSMIIIFIVLPTLCHFFLPLLLLYPLCSPLLSLVITLLYPSLSAPPNSTDTVNMEEFLDAASSRLPTLRGIKYSSMDLHQLGRCVLHSGGRFTMMYGCDEVERQGTLQMDCNSTLVLFGCIIEFNNRVTITMHVLI